MKNNWYIYILHYMTTFKIKQSHVLQQNLYDKIYTINMPYSLAVCSRIQD